MEDENIDPIPQGLTEDNILNRLEAYANTPDMDLNYVVRNAIETIKAITEQNRKLYEMNHDLRNAAQIGQTFVKAKVSEALQSQEGIIPDNLQKQNNYIAQVLNK